MIPVPLAVAVQLSEWAEISQLLVLCANKTTWLIIINRAHFLDWPLLVFEYDRTEEDSQVTNGRAGGWRELPQRAKSLRASDRLLSWDALKTLRLRSDLPLLPPAIECVGMFVGLLTIFEYSAWQSKNKR